MGSALQVGYSHIAGYLQVVLQIAITLNIAREKWTAKRLAVTAGIIYIPHVVIVTWLRANDKLLGQMIWVFFLFCIYHLFFHISRRKSLLLGILQMLANTFLEYMLILLVTFLPGRMQLFLSSNLHVSRTIVILLYLALFIVTQRINRRHVSEVELQVRNLWFVYLIGLYILIDPIVLRIEDGWAQAFVDNQADLLNVVLLVVLFVFNLAYIQSIRKTAVMSQQLEHNEMYAGSLEKSSEALRGFKHDFSNIINTIDGYVELGDLPALKSYMRELNRDVLNIKTTNIVNSELKRIPILYGMLLSKLSVAELRGIVFEVSVQCDVDYKYYSVVDFSRMIGILLDNAIEAAAESEEKIVLLEIFYRGGRQCISISNSCDKPVDIARIYQSGYTTKKEHAGQGLHQVCILIKKYTRRGRDISLQASCQNGRFCHVLKI